MRILALLLLAATTSALADDAGILRCRAIKDSAARLACYDGIAVPSAAAAQPKAGTPAAAASASASAPAAAATPAAPATPAQQFGLESKTPVAQLDSVESTVPGLFKGWSANTIITLANGQQWQISDGSSGYVNMENAKVKIKRGFMGSFYLDIEGNNRVPRVRRVK
jgi:hypothetical protein